jgi:hypothetical protein
MIPDDARCASCRWFVPVDSSAMTKAIAQQSPGRCHRLPPQLVQSHARWEWPLVYARHWCGEWLNKAIVEPKK